MKDVRNVKRRKEVEKRGEVKGNDRRK